MTFTAAAHASKVLREPTDDRVSLLYTADSLSSQEGGLRTDERFLHNVDLFSRLRFSGGTSVYLHGSYNSGESFSEDVVGDVQVASNIEAAKATRLYQAYYELGSEATDAGFLFGLWDLNSRIDVIAPAGLFMNSSHGIGAEFALSGKRGPSIFPVTSLALYGHTRLGTALTLRGAILDGVPGDPERPHRTDIDLSRDDGALLVTEAEWSTNARWTAKAGLWHYTSQIDHLDDSRRDGFGQGVYASLAGDLMPNRLSGWLRYGVANDKVQNVRAYFGAGLVLNKIPGALEDEAGIAIATAFASRPLRDDGASRTETSLELTYSVKVTPWLRLQPDLQYIVNPGFKGGPDDAVVIGMRMELMFSKRF